MTEKRKTLREIKMRDKTRARAFGPVWHALRELTKLGFFLDVLLPKVFASLFEANVAIILKSCPKYCFKSLYLYTTLRRFVKSQLVKGQLVNRQFVKYVIS